MRRSTGGATLATAAALAGIVISTDALVDAQTRSGPLATGRGDNGRALEPEEVTEIYEVVVFEVEGVCGPLDSVKADIERAFLSYYEEEFGFGSTDRDVIAVNLVDWEEALDCQGGRALAGRELNKKKKSRGKLNRKSECTGCDRRALDADDFGGDVPAPGPSSRELAAGRPCDDGSCEICERGVPEGRYYHRYCDDARKFVQCDDFERCFVRDCDPGTGWSQELQTCWFAADLAEEFRKVGFIDVEDVDIISTTEVDCSITSDECTSRDPTRGACCGADGCACNRPSDSLCASEGCCIEEARNCFSSFCENFGGCGRDPCGGRCPSETAPTVPTPTAPTPTAPTPTAPAPTAPTPTAPAPTAPSPESKCDDGSCQICVDSIRRGRFYHEYCYDRRKFVQCDELGECSVRSCPPRLIWSQESLTCVRRGGENQQH